MKRPSMKNLVEHWALVGVLIWLEFIFKVSTTGGLWPQMLFVVLFSTAAGMLMRLALSFLPSKHANKIAKTVCMTLAGVVFCVEYFVYREFKLFYDLNTVTAGAGDAATGFADQIWALVLSPGGILHIVLFLAPAIAYAFLGNGELLCEETNDLMTTRVRMGRNALLVHLSGLLLLNTVGTFGLMYDEQYSFQSSVTSFGLVTSLRKDIQNNLMGNSQVTFKQLSGEPLEEVPEEEGKQAHATAEEAQPTQQDFGVNALNIDFAQLAFSADPTWSSLDAYVASLQPSSKNQMTGRFAGYNLIFVSAEALSAEAIRPDTTPTLWRMANKGMQFTDYYQFDSAGTTGGECANIFGLLATEGGSSVKGTAGYNNYYTMGNALNRLGYNGWAFHNNTFTYYSRDLTHNNLGYNNGYMGYGNGMEQWVQWQWPQSDLEMVQGTWDNLYGKKELEPFNVYYMSVSGHSGYVPGENAMSEKHMDAVAELPYSDPVKGYLACNIELDAAMKYLIDQLEALDMADHTVIVLGADHFPYGLDDDGPLGSLPYTSELYGYDVQTYFQRDHNRLIIWSGSLEDADPIVVDTPTSSIDVLPTLLNLFGCEWDSRLLPGRDVFGNKEPLIFNLSYDWKTNLGTFFASTGTFEPANGVFIPKGYVEATSADVANRITYCHGVLTSDYYRHVFGDPNDVGAVHDAAVAAAQAQPVTITFQTYIRAVSDS